MAGSPEVIRRTTQSDSFIRGFRETLQSIDPHLAQQVNFTTEIQKKNLMTLVDEARRKLSRYEHIYPYIKELCQNQTINPMHYNGIENVLNWALKKGRGKSKTLSKEIQQAWITYIVVLSCSMIDKDEASDESRNIFLSSRDGKISGLTGSN